MKPVVTVALVVMCASLGCSSSGGSSHPDGGGGSSTTGSGGFGRRRRWLRGTRSGRGRRSGGSWRGGRRRRDEGRRGRRRGRARPLARYVLSGYPGLDRGPYRFPRGGRFERHGDRGFALERKYDGRSGADNHLVPDAGPAPLGELPQRGHSDRHIPRPGGNHLARGRALSERELRWIRDPATGDQRLLPRSPRDRRQPLGKLRSEQGRRDLCPDRGRRRLEQRLRGGWRPSHDRNARKLRLRNQVLFVGRTDYDQTFVGTDTEALAQGIAIAPNGDVVVAGYFNATMKVGTKSLQSAAGLASNGFFAILDPSTGAPRSSFSFGGTNIDVASSVAVTSAGNLRIVGSLTATSTVGGKTVQADPNTSAFIAEVTTAGTANWVNLVGSGTPGAILQTAINTADVSFAVGHLRETGTTDAIVAGVDSAGHVSIPVRVANPDGNGATDCAADHHGGVWVTGEFQGTTDLGAGTLTAADSTLPSNFVLHLQP